MYLPLFTPCFLDVWVVLMAWNPPLVAPLQNPHKSRCPLRSLPKSPLKPQDIPRLYRVKNGQDVSFRARLLSWRHLGVECYVSILTTNFNVELKQWWDSNDTAGKNRVIHHPEMHHRSRQKPLCLILPQEMSKMGSLDSIIRNISPRQL